jgi:hypothetical protein
MSGGFLAIISWFIEEIQLFNKKSSLVVLT